MSRRVLTSAFALLATIGSLTFAAAQQVKEAGNKTIADYSGALRLNPKDAARAKELGFKP
jgi:hypothetical protein